MSPPPGLQPGSGGGPSPTRGPGGQRAVAEALGALLLPLPLRGQERADGGGRVRGRGGGGLALINSAATSSASTGGWRRTWRRAGQGGGAGRRRLKSGEVCAQLTAGREGAGKVSLLDFGEVGLKHGDKAVCLLAYNTNWG